MNDGQWTSADILDIADRREDGNGNVKRRHRKCIEAIVKHNIKSLTFISTLVEFQFSGRATVNIV